MSGSSVPDAGRVEAVAHVSLQVGRLLLLNGSDTGRVEVEVTRFAAAFGCETNLLVSYEAMLLTVVAAGHFRTKIGYRLPAMNVGMAVAGAVNGVVDDAVNGRLVLEQARAELDKIEHLRPEYSRWLVVLMLGLTAASLSRLFGGDWQTFVVSWVAGAAGTWLRQELGRRKLNSAVIPFVAACAGGIIGGAGALLTGTGTPALCLVASAMIIVPGVPLINSVEDMITNHMTLGISRLGFAGLVTAAIGSGLFVATVLTGVGIPVDAPVRAVAVSEDALFSALAALGYVFLFNVPARVAWACVICGVASHTLRTLCVSAGTDIIAGTLIGALAAGFLAQGFARHFHAPAAAFAFPGVVAMVPGAYAFRAVIGGLRIAHGEADLPLVAETMALSITVALMVAAIAIGIAVPALLFASGRDRQTHLESTPE